MVDELGLPELIDTVIKQDHEQRQVSVGLCVKAMILNGLGFVNRALSLMPRFLRSLGFMANTLFLKPAPSPLVKIHKHCKTALQEG